MYKIPSGGGGRGSISSSWSKRTRLTWLIKGEIHNCNAMKVCLTWPMWHTKCIFPRKTQFLPHCYTVVPYQALFWLSVYKNPAVYLSGANILRFCTIRDFGSTTITFPYGVLGQVWYLIIVSIPDLFLLSYFLYSPNRLFFQDNFVSHLGGPDEQFGTN